MEVFSTSGNSYRGPEKLERVPVSTPESLFKSSFFDVEVSEFLGKPNDVIAAIAAVSKRLAPSHGAIW